LAVARQIQFALLPERLPESRLFEVDAFTRPAREVGGDFYDFFTTPAGTLGVVIGDASGKSVPAALMMAQLQAVLRNETRAGASITRVMDSLNRCAAAGSQQERFVTMVYGELDAESGRFRYCNAGHNYPILARRDGSWQSLETGGLLLGVFEDARYEEGEVYLQPDDVLVLYTDGFTEIRSADADEFGEGRLARAIVRNRPQAPSLICQALLHEALTHADTAAFDDDATVVVLKQLMAPAAVR
jgi:sigma-B regulation protein RsbU (phosphoserine phosphatase)